LVKNIVAFSGRMGKLTFKLGNYSSPTSRLRLRLRLRCEINLSLSL
jgi:hypothetical protein